MRPGQGLDAFVFAQECTGRAPHSTAVLGAKVFQIRGAEAAFDGAQKKIAQLAGKTYIL